MIRKKGNEIKINQDFYGSCGLYFYENKNTQYFALSNSFLLLEEYLIGNQNLTFNQNFADKGALENFIANKYHIYQLSTKYTKFFLYFNNFKKKKNLKLKNFSFFLNEFY